MNGPQATSSSQILKFPNIINYSLNMYSLREARPHNIYDFHQAWLHKPLISAFRWQRQADLGQVKSSLVYNASSGTAINHVSNDQRKKKQTKKSWLSSLFHDRILSWSHETLLQVIIDVLYQVSNVHICVGKDHITCYDHKMYTFYLKLYAFYVLIITVIPCQNILRRGYKIRM